jgi:hypothetical protein
MFHKNGHSKQDNKKTEVYAKKFSGNICIIINPCILGCFQSFLLFPKYNQQVMKLMRLPVAALFPDIFCNFYLVKKHTIAKNSTIIKAKEKISTELESLEF